MKIGILTLNGYYNLGNRLQNYALEKNLMKLGFKVETLLNENKIEKIVTNKVIKIPYKDIFKLLKYKINKKKYVKLIKIRKKSFKNFSEKYLNEINFSITQNFSNNHFCSEYDYFIAGSDQVWNPNDDMVSEFKFLTFAPKEKRLTYAPSFGVSQIPEEYKVNYTKWLNGIENISVREDAGAKIVKELTGKDATVVVDPTMLLTKKEWLEISKVHENKPIDKYLLTYFLGEIPKEVKRKIKTISRKNNLEIINLAQIKEEKYYLADPSEFIDYINDAKVFVTDSFHGCVFALLMDTPLVVCDRIGQTSAENMSSRIETFVNKFNIQDRQFNQLSDDKIFETNYTKAYEVLEVERKKSAEYLNKILKIKIEK